MLVLKMLIELMSLACFLLYDMNIMSVCVSEADLNIAQTAWGDSGVYVCSVASSEDLSGNGEDYTELIVLGKIYGLCCSPQAYLKSNASPSFFCYEIILLPLYTSGFIWCVVQLF